MKEEYGCLAMSILLLILAALVLGIIALVFMFYGAVFGAIGAGAYLAFKFLAGLFL